MPAGHAMTSRDTVLSIDCGGTHTDAVCVRAGRVEAQAKVATRHDSLPLSISEVLDEIAAQLGKNALSLVQRIREERKFASVEELAGQLRRDAGAARGML